MRLKIKHIILFFVIYSLQSCISEYNPTELAGNPDIIVVDGIITNGETVVRLSKSIGINEKFSSAKHLYNAKVYVETGNGELSEQAKMTEAGKYVIANVDLKADREYRLKIIYNEDTLVSEFLSPLHTPEIDSITWKKPAPGAAVELFVHAKDTSNLQRFYRWTYEEIWEYTAKLYANVGINPIDSSRVLYDEVNGPRNERYYCWNYKKSSSFILESSANLSDNIIRYKKIHEIPATNNRLSVLYYIIVNQYHVRKSAYDYFENQQKNIESMGSIFAPIPSEMKGNIKCINREIPVIGFVDVAFNTSNYLYISGDENLYESPYTFCEVSKEMEPGYLPYTFDPMSGDMEYAPAHCIDCLKMGGTKNKPDFWPNSHL